MPKFKNKIIKVLSRQRLLISRQRHLIARKRLLSRKRLLFIPLGIILIICLIFLVYNLIFWGKIFPGIYLDGVYLGGETPSSALTKLNSEITLPGQITLVRGEQKFEITLDEIGVTYDILDSVATAYSITRTGNILYDFGQRLRIPLQKVFLGMRFNLDEQKLQTVLTDISDQIAQEPVYPSVSLINKIVVVDRGKAGSELDSRKLRLLIDTTLAQLNPEPITIPQSKIDPTLTDEEADALKVRAEKLIGKNITLKFEYQTFIYNSTDLFTLLDTTSPINERGVSEIISKITSQVNRNPQEPVFVFEGGRVNEFKPSLDGVTVKEAELKSLLAENLKILETEDTKSAIFDIPTQNSPAKIKTADVNNMGIKQLIGRGTSRFRGSIPNRIHNIVLASSKFKGVIVSPGETFSFNTILGDVSELTGFKQAYVIKEGKTVLGDGGGVCQVSTTLFRALLNAGLPILERQAHAYRVGYYEQDSPPGLDATVFAPSPDLKFKNDTPGHILIQSSVDTQNASLVFEIYGTSDGRAATTSKPVITSQVAPEEDLYIDDPTLPAGTVKQTEHKAWGARVTFNYNVERNGETIYQKTFVSVYRPWQAVYLRGTAPAQ